MLRAIRQSSIEDLKKRDHQRLYHFLRADIGLGMAIAQGLGINPEQAIPKQHSKESPALA